MEAEKIQVTANNVRQLKEYVDAMRELNKFVKENFGKKTRENTAVLSISPIISDIHKELDILTKKITEWEKRNHSVLKDGAFYRMKQRFGSDEFYHILKKHNDGKRLNVEKIEANAYGAYGTHLNAYLQSNNRAQTGISSTQLLDAYYGGKLEEISEDEWNQLVDTFNASFTTIAKILGSEKE